MREHNETHEEDLYLVIEKKVNCLYFQKIQIYNSSSCSCCFNWLSFIIYRNK